MKKKRMYSATALAAFTAVAVGATGVMAEETIFTDVSASHPYAEGINSLTSAGIVKGFGDGTFKPDTTVTRGQAAKMIAGALKLDTTNVKNPNLKDIKTSNQYYSQIAALVATGFVNGYEDGTFRTADKITHGQLAKILTNVSAVYPIDATALLTEAKVVFNPTKQLTRGELSSVLATMMAAAAPAPQPEPETNNYKLSIMHVNDTHSRVEALPKLMTAVNEQRAKTPDALLLHAGDVFSGTLYFNEFEGQADLPFLNALKFDAMTLGNHEFDLGDSTEGHKALAEFIKAAQFPILTANVDFTKDSLFTGLFSDLVSSEPENGKIYAGMIKEVDGEKVGIFGLTTAETKEIASPGSVAFENYIDEAKKAVKAFEDKGVDKIIALTHIGYDDNPAIDNDLTLAKTVPGIDIIVGAHSHTKLEEPFIVDTNTVGEKKDATLIVQAYQYTDFLGTLNVEFDDKGVIVKHDGQLIEVGKLADDAEGLKMLAPYKEKVDALGSVEIGVTLTEKLVNPRKSETSPISVRNSETALGNIITDGMLAKAKQYTDKKVVMALQNGGGIRAEIPAGNVTIGQVMSVLTFGNTLSLVELTGADIKAAFENSVKDAPEEHGRFLHISGGKLTYDSSKEVGSRVISVQYFDEATSTYVDLKDDETYVIATNAFTAKGQEGYTTFEKAYNEGRVIDLGLSDWENLKEHLTSLKEIKYTTEGRIVDTAAPQEK
ncbi:5'-nucleotidase C-terminal domain-containing protein [Solibacillus sp. FSL K6-1126]|uniref:5'-nucleotidase C-terminal domain-containing protein n=1 Tax=Solibacillus sp. FSL K6-1126 TaxID=2921463 RepID=UPI0030FA6314